MQTHDMILTSDNGKKTKLLVEKIKARHMNQQALYFTINCGPRLKQFTIQEIKHLAGESEKTESLSLATFSPLS